MAAVVHAPPKAYLGTGITFEAIPKVISFAQLEVGGRTRPKTTDGGAGLAPRARCSTEGMLLRPASRQSHATRRNASLAPINDHFARRSITKKAPVVHSHCPLQSSSSAPSTKLRTSHYSLTGGPPALHFSNTLLAGSVDFHQGGHDLTSNQALFKRHVPTHPKVTKMVIFEKYGQKSCASLLNPVTRPGGIALT